MKALATVTALVVVLLAARLDAESNPPTKKLPVPGEVLLVAGRTAFISAGKTDAADKAKPWVWYAPVLTDLPGKEERWMFEQLRDAGIAVAGIDVGESYGSPAGRELFTAFYAEMTEARG